MSFTDALDIADSIAENLCGRLSPIHWIEAVFGRKVYAPNQTEIIEAIFDQDVQKVLSMEARQSGKTEAYVYGILAHIQLSTHPLKWGVFGPKEGQAFIIMDRIHALCRDLGDALPKKIIDYKRKDPLGTGLLAFDDGTTFRASSASITTQLEGGTYDCVLLDECHRIDYSVISEKILPMLGATSGRVFMNGIMVPAPHVEAALADKYTKKIIYDWTQCPWLLSDGQGNKKLGYTYTLVPFPGGEFMERSVYVLERMPRVIKQELYPDNPKVPYRGDNVSIWDVGSGDMDPDDFRQHYMMKRSLLNDAYMTESEMEVISSGTHEILLTGISGESYFAGIDFAGADTVSADYTVISIVRITPSGEVQKVHCQELYGIEYEEQYDIICDLCSYADGRFRCKVICADMTGVGLPAVSSIRRRGNMNIIGILFSKSHVEFDGKRRVSSGKNMKNTMFEHMKTYGAAEGKFKYPNVDAPVKPEYREQHNTMVRGLEQWRRLLFTNTGGPNKKIYHQRGYNDDIPCADVLALWAACGKAQQETLRLPLPRMAHNIG